MRVLVACEYSGTVRDAFTALGHDAWSCDILPTETPGNHFKCDLFDVINDDWDLIIGFPPCTHLASSGAMYWKEKKSDGRQQAAIDFVLQIYNNKCSRIAIENPTGVLSTVWRKPDQIIHPYFFGDPFMKRTCLWLKNLPALYWNQTDTLFEKQTAVEPQYHFTSNSYRGGMRKDGTRKVSEMPVFNTWDTGKERSKSFNGISRAMAEQWGNL